MELSKLSRDSKAASEGAWIDGMPGMGDFRVKVRGNTSPEVISRRIQLEQAASMDERNENGMLTVEAQTRIMRQVQHEVVLMDWENLTIDGEPVQYSADMAERIVMNPDMVAFRDIVAAASIKVSSLPGKLDGIVVKN